MCLQVIVAVVRLLGCLVGGAKPPPTRRARARVRVWDEMTEPARGQPRLARVTQPTPKPRKLKFGGGLIEGRKEIPMEIRLKCVTVWGKGRAPPHLRKSQPVPSRWLVLVAPRRTPPRASPVCRKGRQGREVK